MITFSEYSAIASKKLEAEADRLERECINPQLVKAEPYTGRGKREAASFNASEVDRKVIAVLLKRAEEAGWNASISTNGWFTIYEP